MNLNEILAMTVPAKVMKTIVSNKEIESKKNSAEVMARAIVREQEQIGRNLAQQFRFAGSTPVNLSIAMSGIDSKWCAKDFFKSKLIEKYGSHIFDKGLRPNLDKTPQIINAFEYDDKIVIALSYLGNPNRVWENFETVLKYPQLVEYVVIHFAPFAIETRTKHERDDAFKDVILEFMNCNSKTVIWEKATKLTEKQAKELAQRLKARLRSAKHKMTEGPYATKEVTAHTRIEDLGSHEQYKEEFNDQPMKSQTLVFNYQYSFGHKESVSYVITDNGLWIRSNVGEEVISYILEQIKEIRYPKQSSILLDETDEAYPEEYDLDFDSMTVNGEYKKAE